MIRGCLRLLVACTLLSAAACRLAQAQQTPTEPLAEVSIMALGALDGRAVVKTADNKMHVLKLGTVIPGTKATVTQILADKLVVEDALEGGQTQTVWISKGGSDGKAVVQRLNSEAPAPAMVEQTTNAQFVDLNEQKKFTKKKTGEK
jgi:hypothetical protein